MAGETETELKLQCTKPAIWPEILQADALQAVVVPGSAGEQWLEAHYYDTADRRLQQQRLAYRVRREGDVWMATVKGGGSAQGGLHRRQEWNIPVEGPEPDLSVFAATPVGLTLQQAAGGQPLISLLITRFARQTLDVRWPDGSEIEVAADRGEILAAGGSEPILEIELELKAGRPAALCELGAALAREFPLVPESRSKFYRGLLLAGLAAQPAATAAPSWLTPAKGERLGKALRQQLAALLQDVLRELQRLLQEPEEETAVHALRVAIRRLRSVLALAKPLLPSEPYRECQAGLRQAAALCADLRQLDVLQQAWAELQQETAPDGDGQLGGYLAKLRRRQQQETLAACQGGMLTPALLALWALLLDDGCWPADDTKAWQPAVNKRLGRWLRRLTDGAAVVTGPGEALHDLRILTKKARYAAEWLQTVQAAWQPATEALRGLQEYLGDWHDAAELQDVLFARLGHDATRAVHWEAGLLAGWKLKSAQQLEADWPRYRNTFHAAIKPYF